MEASLVHAQAVKDLLEVRSTTFDAALWKWCKLASKEVSKWCRTNFTLETTDEFFDTRKNYTGNFSFYGDGVNPDTTTVNPRIAYLSRSPITDATIWNSPYREYTDTALLVADRDFLLDKDTGKLQVLIATDNVLKGMKVTYTAGYDYRFADADTAYTAQITERASVDTNLVLGGGEAALFDQNDNSSRLDGAYRNGVSGFVQINFLYPELLDSIRWSSPNDSDLHGAPGGTGSILSLWGSVTGDFSDEVLLVSKTITSAQINADYELHYTGKIAYLAYRVVATSLAGAYTCAAEVSFTYRDKTRPYMIDVPDDLAGAAAIIAKAMWERNRQGSVDNAGEAGGAKGQGLVTTEIANMLSPYRRVLVGRG